MEFYATPPIDGAFCRYVLIDDDMAHAVPDSISDDAAALLEPLSVAITTMRKAHVAPGSSILIAGAGPIGVICAQAARAFGAARIVVTDLVASRRDKALQFGATEVLDPAAVDVSANRTGRRVRRRHRGARGRRQRYQGRRTGVGTWCSSAWAPTSTRCPSATSRTWRSAVTGVFRYTDTWPAAIHLVASGAVDLDGMVTGRYDLEHVGEALDSDSDPASLKSIVVPS